MKNYYKAAIDILSQTKTEEQRFKLLVQIAKNNPHALVRASGANKHGTGWQSVALRTERNSEAVKACRDETGASLKDAVDMVKALPGRIW
jgi:ribosomal protein L7/L12